VTPRLALDAAALKLSGDPSTVLPSLQPSHLPKPMSSMYL